MGSIPNVIKLDKTKLYFNLILFASVYQLK